MKRVVVLAFLALLAMSLPAHAVTFQLDSLTVGSSDPGLVLGGGLNYRAPVNFNLDCPECGYDSVHFDDLFYLYNTESALNLEDDFAWIPLTLTFNFSLPSSAGQIVSGESVGYFSLNPFGRRWAVDLDNPTLFSFTDGAFNYELLAVISPGEANFGWTETGYFDVTFKLKECEAVPIPGALWLLGSGLAALVGFRRKKSQ
ncbi:MAG: VPLPA-CTERM sorting domain-containing protein [Deltaproteobacteria bacterium]|nr:VPLPA-CTERM sorting domain-containing protein [Deltaproteobacteria bacterium]